MSANGQVAWVAKLQFIVYTSGALKIIKNGIELRKLWPPKVEGVKNSKKKPLNVTKASLQTPKKSSYVVLLLLKLQDDL
jgi:hypothetical protein